MTERPTPLCNRAQFHRDNGHDREHSIVVSVDFARDLERKLAEAREALELAANLPTHQDCPVENHGIVVAAMDALARIDAKGKETA